MRHTDQTINQIANSGYVRGTAPHILLVSNGYFHSIRILFTRSVTLNYYIERSVLLSLKRGNSNLSLERGKKNGLELLEMAFASWLLYEACGDEGIYACGGYDCGFVDANGPRGSDDRANNVEY
ncbi:hypothetical protein BUALT_Bualt02G0047600 [Buddleja alternifolia]|uniref:Uncharacterized protein n=1 Tax=Buddleja alternifolia TaxID=168488 RepID=A0AAV6Y471_9LAMI|nr:hypothetical protein BUALT_Bualt02G0047600 [Buddleja alternifolia]